MMDEQGLSKLIDKAARNNNIPEIRHANRPHSPGFIDVYLCGVEVECFDTYYYTAAQKAGDLVSSLNVRIRDCASDIIKEKDDANVLLKVELVELRKANSELEKNQIKWINCRADLPEYGVPVTVKAHGVVQNVTYTLSGAGEDFDVKLDWFEPYLFDHDDNCKIPLSNNVEWMLLPEAGN
jgi:hypothetical protein